ncbi:SDR family oxidoreductase [Priestia aryabhattai]|uniref:SDR family oxidoreductase n=1 Tax=Priestia aryabhattai TaxID=412384 RepID=UPI00187536E5|nr:SDR family oxidoreductase [Priestia aryabhattai]MBE5102374.1 SDR family oxidoreductase [Priestia aryabhattai]
MTIENKVVIITGASSGIGEATAKLLASKGAKVVLAARREDKLERITSEIINAGGKATYRVTDVTKPEDNQKLVDLAKENFGKVDAIFLNAGIMPNSPFSALKVNEWNEMIDINIKGVLNGIAAVLPTFKEQKSGHVITTSSVAGLKSYPGVGVYGATKWAVRELMEVLRMESAQEGSNIRTATLYPAAINTELLESITDTDTLKGATALYEQHGITPDRIANVVAFAIDQPEDTNVNEFTIGPTSQPW